MIAFSTLRMVSRPVKQRPARIRPHVTILTEVVAAIGGNIDGTERTIPLWSPDDIDGSAPLRQWRFDCVRRTVGGYCKNRTYGDSMSWSCGHLLHRFSARVPPEPPQKSSHVWSEHSNVEPPPRWLAISVRCKRSPARFGQAIRTWPSSRDGFRFRRVRAGCRASRRVIQRPCLSRSWPRHRRRLGSR